MSEQEMPVHEQYEAERTADPHAEPPLESLAVEQETATESEGVNADEREQSER